MPNVKNKVRLCTTSPMSIFIVENLGGTPFYNRRDDFERLLDKYVTNPRYKHFFAMPYFEPALHGLEWHVDPEFAYAVKHSSLAGTQQYLAAKQYIADATAYFRNLATQVNEWEQPYFDCLIKYIDSTDIDEMVFVANDQVILGVWGIRAMPGQNMNTSIVTNVEDTRLHRVSFETHNATLQGTTSFMRRHGYKLHPGIDVPKVLPNDGFAFVSWLPFDPNNAQVNEDLHFVAQCEEIKTPPPYQPGPETPPPPMNEPHMCQVKFDNGALGTLSGKSPSLTVPAGTVLTPAMIPAVTPLAGYSFLGWDQPVDKPITGDTTFVAQYSKLPWWKRWMADGCLRWLLMALLALLLFLLLAIVLTRCTSCSGTMGGCVRDAHDRIMGADTTDTISGRTRVIIHDERVINRIRTDDGRYIDDNGNERGVIDISDDLDGDDPVAPPLVDDNGDPISDRGRLNPDDPNSPEVMSDRLNIFFDNDNPDFQKFATEFKRNYPGDQYKIIGKDKNTRWLLVQVPPQERPKIRDELPSKIPSMKFKVVDEVIMAGGQQHGGSRSTLPKGWHLDAAHIKQAWQVSKGNAGVTVAVVDDGIDLNHEMFAGRITKPYNVFRCDDHLSAGMGHGTHVAGLAAGNTAHVSQGAAGVAPNCQIMPVQVFDNGQCTISGVIRGIMYAIRNNADVVNISIGTAYPVELGNIVPIEEQKEVARSYYKPAEDVWKWVFEQAGKKNTILVFAAGNSHLLAAMQPQLRSKNTINVGALGKNNTMTEWSNFGSTVYVTAPGEGIYSSMPGNRYQAQDGTSMAAPIVTGVVALMKSVNKNITVAQALTALTSTGVNISNGNQSGPAVQADKAVTKARQR